MPVYRRVPGDIVGDLPKSLVYLEGQDLYQEGRDYRSEYHVGDREDREKDQVGRRVARCWAAHSGQKQVKGKVATVILGPQQPEKVDDPNEDEAELDERSQKL